MSTSVISVRLSQTELNHIEMVRSEMGENGLEGLWSRNKVIRWLISEALKSRRTLIYNSRCSKESV